MTFTLKGQSQTEALLLQTVQNQLQIFFHLQIPLTGLSIPLMTLQQ